MTSRRWTHAEVEALRQCYQTPTGTLLGHLPIRALARRLGRTYDACVVKAKVMGLTRSRPETAEFSLTIRRLHRNGHSMREIGRRLRMSDVSVKFAMSRLGITPRGKHEPTATEKDRWRDSFGGYLERSGHYQSLRELVTDRQMGEAMARWPIATTGRQADVLDELAAGYARIGEVAVRLGIGKVRVTNILKELMRLGAVRVVSKGDRKATGGKPAPWEYAIFPGIERGKVASS